MVGILIGAGVGIWALLKKEHSKNEPPFTVTVTGFSTGDSTQSNTYTVVQALLLQSQLIFSHPANIAGVLYFYVPANVTFTALPAIPVPTPCTTCQPQVGKTPYKVTLFGFPGGTGNFGFPIEANQPILNFSYLFLAS